jgi:hypothetical protein
VINLADAIVYDVETLPNVFTLNAVGLHTDLDITFEISEFRDDRRALLAWFEHWSANRTPMIGFNNVGFDYLVLHFIWCNPECTVYDIYDYAMSIIRGAFGGDRFGFMVWESDRFAPQIDLFKIHHLDNRAKSTSLKALQFAMRSESVMEMPLGFDQPLTREQIDRYLIPYNKHDVAQTKRFALFSLDAINFRLGLSDTLRGDVLNWSDTKIGGKILEQRLGPELCYDEYRQPRQTYRSQIPLNDIIFPYVRFSHPEFQRVLTWMRGQSLTSDDIEVEGAIRTKGVFKGVTAHVGGIDFDFGTGGIHGSVSSQRIFADAEWGIYDIDVAALYPSLAIVNRLYPEHLGERFVDEYAKLPKERKEWQVRKGKKCAEANSMKLAGNGTYGNSNSQYSVFYDPRFTMSITINGQLLLCMLAEWLTKIPTLQIIQINTDGITYRCRRDWNTHAVAARQAWERYTCLVLEDVEYSRMWIRDVNNYIGQYADGTTKLKGAYWYPKNFPDDISNAQPPGWHKDYSAQIIIMAAVANMVEGVDIERYVYGHADPFDFMCRAKVDRSSKLYIGDQEQQRICRYYIATSGGEMKKVSPPTGPLGSYKKSPKVSDAEYRAVMAETGGAWDARVCTKKKTQHIQREMSIDAGYRVAECNVAARFDFGNLNYEYYIDAAKKLVIP